MIPQLSYWLRTPWLDIADETAFFNWCSPRKARRAIIICLPCPVLGKRVWKRITWECK